MKKAIIFILFLVATTVQSQNVFDTIVLIPHTPIKDQQSSGTCWSFGTTSFIESELLRSGKDALDLSEMYFVYFATKAKAEMHVRMQGNNFFTPGGQMHDVMNVIRENGLMPETAFGGYTTRNRGHNHSLLDTTMAHYMQMVSGLEYPDLPSNYQFVVDSILSALLGTPPQTFSLNNKQWTAEELRDSLFFDPDKYVSITSYNHHPYYSWFVLEDRYNWANGLYYNVPPDVFEEICDSALLKGYSFVWDGDVSESSFKAEAGTAIINLQTNVDIGALRQQMFNSHETTVDHVMHIVGKLRKYNGDEYFLVKNSWGIYGKNQGYILMNRGYFLLKTVAVMMSVDALPKDMISRININ